MSHELLCMHNSYCVASIELTLFHRGGEVHNSLVSWLMSCLSSDNNNAQLQRARHNSVYISTEWFDTWRHMIGMLIWFTWIGRGHVRKYIKDGLVLVHMAQYDTSCQHDTSCHVLLHFTYVSAYSGTFHHIMYRGAISNRINMKTLNHLLLQTIMSYESWR